jgi:hypothetical protein
MDYSETQKTAKGTLFRGITKTFKSLCNGISTATLFLRFGGKQLNKSATQDGVPVPQMINIKINKKTAVKIYLFIVVQP